MARIHFPRPLPLPLPPDRKFSIERWLASPAAAAAFFLAAALPQPRPLPLGGVSSSGLALALAFFALRLAVNRSSASTRMRRRSASALHAQPMRQQAGSGGHTRSHHRGRACKAAMAQVGRHRHRWQAAVPQQQAMPAHHPPCKTNTALQLGGGTHLR